VGLFRGSERRTDRRRWLRLDLGLECHEDEPGDERVVAGLPRSCLGRDAKGLGLVESAHLDEELGTDSLHGPTFGVGFGEELDRTTDQQLCRPGVAALPRPPGAAQEPPARPLADRRRRAVQRAELDAIAVRVLEVVPDDLVQLDEAGAVLLEPEGEALVQLRPGRLRQRLVRGIADEQVAEAIGLLVREHRLLRAHEILPHELDEPAVHLGLLRREGSDGTAVENEPFDRAALQHAALSGLELIEPRCEEGLDGRRHGDLAALPGRHRDHLLDEERVAAGRLEDALAELRLDSLVELGDQRRSLFRSERLEQHVGRVQLAAAPGRATVEQLRPRHAENQD
jgi:hypothetical protein